MPGTPLGNENVEMRNTSPQVPEDPPPMVVMTVKGDREVNS